MPEAGEYLAKAGKLLYEARAVAAIGLWEAAGRAAYLAAFQAAQAFIFSRTGKVAKTHSGVRSEFARLAKDEPRIDKAFSSFLAQAYLLKTIADYGTGPDNGVSKADAEEAIDTAAQFVARITELLEPGSATT